MSLVPELFDFGTYERLTTPVPPGIETPLGRFTLSATLQPPMQAAAMDHVRAGDVDLYMWDAAAARIELRIATPALALPDGMRISGARAAMWRVRSRQPLSVVYLSCELVTPTVREPVPESGQGLESLLWEAEDINVSLGTPDADGLLYFSQDGAPLPASWTARDAELSTISLVEYRPRGLRVTLPSLAAGELAQTHFVIAWAPPSATDATWFAVDQAPGALLRPGDAGV